MGKWNAHLAVSGSVSGMIVGAAQQVYISGIGVGDYLDPLAGMVLPSVYTSGIADYTIQSQTDYYVGLNPAIINNDLIVYLPDISSVPIGRTYIIKNESMTGNRKINITPSGSNTIDGSNVLSISKSETAILSRIDGIWRRL